MNKCTMRAKEENVVALHHTKYLSCLHGLRQFLYYNKGVWIQAK